MPLHWLLTLTSKQLGFERVKACIDRVTWQRGSTGEGEGVKEIGEKRAELGVEGPGCEESWSRRPTFPSYTVTHNNILDDGIKGPDLGLALDE